jgi:hypothetical protein
MDLPEIDESWLVPDAAAEAPLKRFAPDEMTTCNACQRANAPTRAQCMYCGAPLNESAEPPTVAAPTAQPTEDAKHYVVVHAHPGESIDDAVMDQVAARFQLNTEELRAAFSTGAPLPLTAAASDEDALRIISELNDIGIQSTVVPGVKLKKDVAHVNIRALELVEGGVTAISRIGKQRMATRLSDIALIITGRLLVHRIEVDERRSRSAVKALDRRELSQDQTVIDLYTQSSDAPWRIIVNDFDFSCFGERKGLTAFDNAKALIALLKERSPAELNDAYARIRPVLAHVWPMQNTESQGRSRRPRAGRHEFSVVSASDNEEQFNNYSRLVWGLKEQGEKRDRESGSV